MKKYFFIAVTGIFFVFSCASPGKKTFLDSFFFIEGSKGPACWLMEKTEGERQKKMTCYDFQNRKVLTEFSVPDDPGFYFPPSDTSGNGFFIQSGDRLWLLHGLNKLEARNIYTWEILDDNRSFEKKYPELIAGIKQLQPEKYGEKGFDIISNDGKKFYFDMEQLLMQPFEVWEKLINKKSPSRKFYSINSGDPLVLFRNLNPGDEGEPEGAWLNALHPDSNKIYVKGEILAEDMKYTMVLSEGKKNGIFVIKCYQKDPLRISWKLRSGENVGPGYGNEFGFSNDSNKNKKEISFTVQSGKVLIQNYFNTHNAASFHLSDGKRLWATNADTLFKFVQRNIEQKQN